MVEFHADRVRDMSRAVSQSLLYLGVVVSLNPPVIAHGKELSLHTQTAHDKPRPAKSLQAVSVQASSHPEQDEARERLASVPGQVALIDAREVAKGRAASAEDVLAYQPGIYAQSTSGNEAAKISIRGSGLNTFYGGYVLGINFLYDGLPITGAGGTQEDLLSMNGVSFTEVLYGGNAFQYGATSLGGAINLHTETGYTSPGVKLSWQSGSYGDRKYSVSAGGSGGGSDYFVGIYRNQREGYQQRTPNHGSEIVGNFGHVFKSGLELRLFVRHREELLWNGGTETLAQIRHDPRINPAPFVRKKPGTTLVGGKVGYTFADGSALAVGADYDNYPLYNSYQESIYPNDWRSREVNLSLRYTRPDDSLWGHHLSSSMIFTDTQLLRGDARYFLRPVGTVNDPKIMTTFSHLLYSGSRNAVLAGSGQLQFGTRNYLVAGLSLIDISRRQNFAYASQSDTSGNPREVRYNTFYLAPRIGWRADLDHGLSYYANATRTIDPPVTWQMNGGSPANVFYPLHAQKSNTLETGLRWNLSVFQGSVSLYRSWITGELLTVVLQQATTTTPAVTATQNARPTIHQGVEVGGTLQLWNNTAGDKLQLRQAFAFNDFHYQHSDGGALAGHQLPGLPRRTWQAELQYQQRRGFYAGVNTRYASSYFADYANTFKVPAYALLGARLGWQLPDQRWGLYVDLRNLTGVRYVSATAPGYDMAGRDSNVFYVGDGRAWYLGASYRF